jgi:hypothetical protein
MTFAYFVVVTEILLCSIFRLIEIREALLDPGFSVWQMVSGSLWAGMMMARPLPRQLRIRS